MIERLSSYEGINIIEESISELKNGTKFTNIDVKRINRESSSLMGTFLSRWGYRGWGGVEE